MKFKKILMIVLLILFIVIASVFLLVTNNKIEKPVSSKETSKETSKEVKTSKGDNIEITDNFFIAETNDIYINLSDYVGKNIKIEGLIYTYTDSNNRTLHAVIRHSPGCCGNDGIVGMDIRYDKEFPSDDTWVEINGVIDSEIVDGDQIPIIKVTSINEKEVGVTFVSN